jgi:hypothetical protein
LGPFELDFEFKIAKIQCLSYPGIVASLALSTFGGATQVQPIIFGLCKVPPLLMSHMFRNFWRQILMSLWVNGRNHRQREKKTLAIDAF